MLKHLAPKLHGEDAALAYALPWRLHKHAELHSELGPQPQLLDLERRRRGWGVLGLTSAGRILLLCRPRQGLHGAGRYAERRREDAAPG
jgi:hypothetical protein